MNIIDTTSETHITFEQQAQLFKVLTHPTRIAILHLLRDGEHCVCHMEAYLGLRQAYLSQQLAVLREAGVISDRRDGWNIFYSVKNPRIFEILSAVQNITGEPDNPISTPVIRCNCPHCQEKQSKFIIPDQSIKRNK